MLYQDVEDNHQRIPEGITKAETALFIITGILIIIMTITILI